MFNYVGKVHDLTVSNTHTYNINGLAVHNSVGGVGIAYLLGITHVNPLRHDLSLDRFITPDRIASGKMPDIDTDFSTREYLLGPSGYLETNFKDRYAQISTTLTLKLKSSIKDVFRFMATDKRVPYEVEKLVSSLPDEPQGIKSYDFLFGYEDTDENHIAGLIEKDERLKKLAVRFPRQWATIIKCLGVPRARSRHACLPAGELILTQVGESPKNILDSGEQTIPTGQGNAGFAKLIPQGKKKVFKYTLSNGKEIKCTSDHRVLTVQGWMEIQQAMKQEIELQEPNLSQPKL